MTTKSSIDVNDSTRACFAPLNRTAFVGAWGLDYWRIEYADGAFSYPFGEEATGLLLYTEGAMSATIAAAHRNTFDLPSARQASVARQAEAFGSYFHYAGWWGIDDQTVVHQVTLALNPDMVGMTQRRLAVFETADHLTLSTTEAASRGGERRHILSWRRRR